MMNVKSYLTAGNKPMPVVKGGTELIVNEIIGCLTDCRVVWVPYEATGTLRKVLQSTGRMCHSGESRGAAGVWPNRDIDAVYIGTPTIVGNGPLFPVPQSARHITWTKESERDEVRRIVACAIERGAKVIVSGLRTGDIEIPDRLDDMGGGSIVCEKVFEQFAEYVLCWRATE